MEFYTPPAASPMEFFSIGSQNKCRNKAVNKK
jgi:hypothetical protein